MATEPQLVACLLPFLLGAVGSVVLASGVRDAGSRIASASFDVAIVDGVLRDGPGLGVVRKLRALPKPCASVLLVQPPVDPILVTQSIELGVNEVILGRPDRDSLLGAAGRARATTRDWRARLEWIRGLDPYAPPGPVARDRPILPPGTELTVREYEVLEEMVAGRSYAQIGHRLGISGNTIKYHARNLLRKLGLRSRRELVRFLLDRS